MCADTSRSAQNKIFRLCTSLSHHCEHELQLTIQMNQNILRHLPTYGVLVCTLCDNYHAVPLDGMGKHFRDHHSNSLSKKQRADLVKYAQTSFKDVLTDPNSIKDITPEFENGPVDGLYKMEGYQCTVCDKLVPRLTTMQIHCREHGWKEKNPDMWVKRWIQVYTYPLTVTNEIDLLYSAPISKVFLSQSTRKSSADPIKSTTYQSPPRTYQSQRTRTRLYTSYNGPRNQQSRPTTVDEGYKLAQDVCRVGHENFSGRLSETKR